jgi:hypothetical protein
MHLEQIAFVLKRKVPPGEQGIFVKIYIALLPLLL